MARGVAVVFTPDFSGQLRKLSFHTPVWIVDTPPNRAAAEELWQLAVEWPHILVTLLPATAPIATQDDWHTLFEQVSLLVRSFDAVEVFGAPLTEPARAAISALHLDRVEETPTGFRARR